MPVIPFVLLLNLSPQNVEDVYSKLNNSTEEVALASFPEKKRRSEIKSSASKRVVDARITLKSICSAYHKSPSQSRGIDFSMEKKQLDNPYLDAIIDYMSGKINELSRYHISNKPHFARKTVKDLGGKNNTSSARIKRGSPQKRL